MLKYPYILLRLEILISPISIKYNYNGLRPDDNYQNSILGVGWSLETYYMIARSVMGKEDEKTYFPFPLKSYSVMLGTSPTFEDYTYFDNLLEGVNSNYDAEYDELIYF